MDRDLLDSCSSLAALGLVDDRHHRRRVRFDEQSMDSQELKKRKRLWKAFKKLVKPQRRKSSGARHALQTVSEVTMVTESLYLNEVSGSDEGGRGSAKRPRLFNEYGVECGMPLKSPDDALSTIVSDDDESSLFDFGDEVSMASCATRNMANGRLRIETTDDDGEASVISVWSVLRRQDAAALFHDIKEEDCTELVLVESDVLSTYDTPWAAAKRGDVRALQEFDDAGVDWAEEDWFASPPLYYACHSGAAASERGLEAVLFLMDHWPAKELPTSLYIRCMTNAINNDVIALLNKNKHVTVNVRNRAMEQSKSYDASDEASTMSGSVFGSLIFGSSRDGDSDDR